MRVGFTETMVHIDELRKSFDASFAAPEQRAPEHLERMLAIRVGDMRLAIQGTEIAAVELIRKLAPLPNPLPGLLGIAGVRRRLVAVYSMGTLLGQKSNETSSRWLLLTAHDPSLALAFDALDGFIEVAQSRILPMGQTTNNEFVRGMVQENNALWALLDISTLTEHALSIARMELRGTEKR